MFHFCCNICCGCNNKLTGLQAKNAIKTLPIIKMLIKWIKSLKGAFFYLPYQKAISISGLKTSLELWFSTWEEINKVPGVEIRAKLSTSQ